MVAEIVEKKRFWIIPEDIEDRWSESLFDPDFLVLFSIIIPDNNNHYEELIGIGNITATRLNRNRGGHGRFLKGVAKLILERNSAEFHIIVFWANDGSRSAIRFYGTSTDFCLFCLTF